MTWIPEDNRFRLEPSLTPLRAATAYLLGCAILGGLIVLLCWIF